MANHIVRHLGLHKAATISLQDFPTNTFSSLPRHGVHCIPLQRTRGRYGEDLRKSGFHLP
jgi:hypothetical protein